jgi:hypothetical protein
VIAALLLAAWATEAPPAVVSLGPWLAATAEGEARCTAVVEVGPDLAVGRVSVADDVGCDTADRAATDAVVRTWAFPSPGAWPVTLVTTRDAARLRGRDVPATVDSRDLRLLSELALGWPPGADRDVVHRCQIDAVLGPSGRPAALAVGGCGAPLHPAIVGAWLGARWGVTTPVTATITTVRFVPEAVRRAEQAAARVAASPAPASEAVDRTARLVQRVAPAQPMVGESTQAWERCAVEVRIDAEGRVADARAAACTEAWRLQAQRALYQWRWEDVPSEGLRITGIAGFRVDSGWHPAAAPRELREARYAAATLRCPAHPARREGRAPPTARCEIDGLVDAEGAVRTYLVHGCDPLFLGAVADALPSWRFGAAAAEEAAQFHQVVRFVAYDGDAPPDAAALACSASRKRPGAGPSSPEAP